MTTTLQYAIAWQRQGFKVFPLAPDTRIPLKGSHPADDATLDEDQAAKWFGLHDYNLGVWLQGSGFVVLDIDKGHDNGADGSETLRRAMKSGQVGVIPSSYGETTPSGGLHLWFKLPAGIEITSGQNLFAEHDADGKVFPSGIDYTGVSIPVSPSEYNDGFLIPMKGASPKHIADAPQWLLAEIKRNMQPNAPLPQGQRQSAGSWRGELLNKIANGVDQGGRNGWVASVTGAMLHDGVDYDNVLDLMDVINRHFVHPPLPVKELAATVNSICKKELRKS